MRRAKRKRIHVGSADYARWVLKQPKWSMPDEPKRWAAMFAYRRRFGLATSFSDLRETLDDTFSMLKERFAELGIAL